MLFCAWAVYYDSTFFSNGLRIYAYRMNRPQLKGMSNEQYCLTPDPKSMHGKEMSIDSKPIYPRLT